MACKVRWTIGNWFRYRKSNPSLLGESQVFSIILPITLYGCEAWSLTLREERRLRVFENRILRQILGPNDDENG